ncbi:hypothetical protein [Sulfurimonas sp.]|uniref:hypothetical protein n=1 Tax=Sulfurimonas sp. TaxID=2022749 RepID=UPI0025E9DEEF|nr:hypothetical protein [Sulfurimonas sp.]MDD5158250.1 hypothetical protein [Sulfurimonas sp.]
MSGVFESTIKMVDGSYEDWFIELKDISDDAVEICKDLSEYSTKIEELGIKYDGVINEVRWSKADNVPPFVMDTIRFEMSKLQRELEEESGEPLIKG